MMLPEERRSKIVEKLHNAEVCTVKELVEEFDVSRITIARDLTVLGSQGVLTKIHGGAKLRKEDVFPYETRFNVRMNQNLDLKRSIAAEAASLIKGGGTIFIDSSTTGYVFATELLKRSCPSLNIITNSPSVLSMVREKHRICLISTGGELNTSFNMLDGSWVVDFLERVNIDMSFISAAGISENNNLTTSSMDIANILNKAIERSAATYLLADSSKFFKKEMINICPLDRCTVLITDYAASAERVKHFQTFIEVRVASKL
ncbi:MAG: DeoR/GlpR family DNA-binding transcription regulator [Synergistaceae bacterium]|jgi:DeoR/GlpR family transcriptional regulator of sugar metabolism|nr:DeoR/GlpR family DNA-binding transcription regulator [Synergistaceae bacterium]